MRVRQPYATRTITLVRYTTLCRSLSREHDRLNLLDGLFYFREKDNGQRVSPYDNCACVAPPSNYLTTGYYGGGFINTKAVAVFGQATYEIAEDLRLTLGARYSTEKKKALDNFLFDVVTPFDPNTSAAFVLQPPAGTISLPGQTRFNSFTPHVAPPYTVPTDILL